MNPRSPRGWVICRMVLAGVGFIGLGCTRTDTSSAPSGEFAGSRTSDPVQGSADPARRFDGQLPDGPGLLPLLCPVCGVNGGGDTTDFGGSGATGCWDEAPFWIGVEEARERGFYPEPEWARFVGDWEASMAWRGTPRQTQLWFTIERTGRVLVLNRYSRDGGATNCGPSVLEELRVSLQAADGSIAGQLEAVPSENWIASPTYRVFSIRDRAVELRGNLQVDIEWEREPLALEVSLEWYDFESEFEDRVRVDIYVRYALPEGRSYRAQIAEAGPADGCLSHELPWAEGCVALWDHPEHRARLPEAGVEQPADEPGPDASVASHPNDAGGVRTFRRR